MRCSKCEFENPAGMKFCGKCRTALGLTCPNCSFDNPPGFDFCGQCAAALHGNAGITKGEAAASKPAAAVRFVAQEAPPTLEGERKTVTALFADIKGSTELMEDLDPEEARAIIDPALKLMIDAVHRYDGYVVQSTGDGIFALFGAPAAHEDHPQRALYAALRMQEELKGYSAKVLPTAAARSRVASGSTPAKSWCARSRPGRVRLSTRRSGIPPTWPRGCRRPPRSVRSRLARILASCARATSFSSRLAQPKLKASANRSMCTRWRGSDLCELGCNVQQGAG
ncbi:MAG TPA: adenylate/guanylate cyclase domain-containing protein [Candidatus Binataceae bacterium]|nr:adenylate/guanylate cyclase domain-containing protein [Candidatus Binataceae bacterium]